MALGVGVLGAERGAEGVHVAEGEREVLGVELAGDGQVRALAEEVLGEVHLAVLGAGQVLQIQRRDAEHLARALGVGAGDDGRVHIHKAALFEEFMHGLRRHAADAERRVEEVRARAQMLDRAQELHAVAFFLQRIVRRGDALYRDLGGLELKRLLGLGRQDEDALDDEGGADVLARDLVIIGELLALHDDLQAFDRAAVVELDEAEVFHVARRARPAADGQFPAVKGLRIGKNTGDTLFYP